MIDFIANDEQTSLVDAVAAYLSDQLPVARLRPKPGLAAAPLQPTPWKGLAGLGWFGVGIAEAHGGSGYGIAEEMLLYREAGRFLLSPAVVGGTLATHAAMQSQAHAWAQRVLSGQLRVGLALSGQGGGGLDLLDADEVDLVAMLGGERIAFYEPAAFTLCDAVPSLDPSVRLTGAELRPGVAPALPPGDAALTLRAHVLLAAMQVGAAEATLNMAVQYAKVREQFGQLIGGFQAVKHKAAEMAVRAESAFCQTSLAALSLAHGAENPAFHAAAAALIASRAAIENAEDNIQLHGGIGFTVECEAHLFLKRAHLVDALLEGTRSQQDRLLAEFSPV